MKPAIFFASRNDVEPYADVGIMLADLRGMVANVLDVDDFAKIANLCPATVHRFVDEECHIPRWNTLRKMGEALIELGDRRSRRRPVAKVITRSEQPITVTTPKPAPTLTVVSDALKPKRVSRSRKAAKLPSWKARPLQRRLGRKADRQLRRA